MRTRDSKRDIDAAQDGQKKVEGARAAPPPEMGGRGGEGVGAAPQQHTPKGTKPLLTCFTRQQTIAPSLELQLFGGLPLNALALHANRLHGWRAFKDRHFSPGPALDLAPLLCPEWWPWKQGRRGGIYSTTPRAMPEVKNESTKTY